MVVLACSREAPGKESVNPGPDFTAWKWHESKAEGYVVFGPSQRTSSSLKIPTPEGDLQVPITYFRIGNDIFYVSSQERRQPGSDAALLEAQARGIEGQFKVGTITREPFVRRGCTGLRLYIRRPDSYKIAELLATRARMYQVVTDLASESAPRMESWVFRFSFFPKEECR